MADEPQLSEGWFCPPTSRKFHYFVVQPRNAGDRGGFALCGKWGFMFNMDVLEAPESATDGPGDCAACRKKLAKRRAWLEGYYCLQAEEFGHFMVYKWNQPWPRDQQTVSATFYSKVMEEASAWCVETNVQMDEYYAEHAPQNGDFL